MESECGWKVEGLSVVFEYTEKYLDENIHTKSSYCSVNLNKLGIILGT